MRAKKINMDSKAAKYFVAHNLKGMKKKDAIVEAGISDIRNTTAMERTDTYQRLEVKYADVLNDNMPKHEVAAELIKNARQDSDKGAKNNALRMLMERVEPEVQQKDLDEQMIVVLRA